MVRDLINILFFKWLHKIQLNFRELPLKKFSTCHEGITQYHKAMNGVPVVPIVTFMGTSTRYSVSLSLSLPCSLFHMSCHLNSKIYSTIFFQNRRKWKYFYCCATWTKWYGYSGARMRMYSLLSYMLERTDKYSISYRWGVTRAALARGVVDPVTW